MEERRVTPPWALVKTQLFLARGSPSKEGRLEGRFCSRADPGCVALTIGLALVRPCLSLSFLSSSRETIQPLGSAQRVLPTMTLAFDFFPFFLLLPPSS